MKKYDYTPDINDKDYLKRIISEKRYDDNCSEKNKEICLICTDFVEKECYKRNLEVNYEKLTSFYSKYNRNLDIEKISPFEKECYISLYTNKTKALKELLEKIKLNFSKETCPYCGIGGVPNTIEHILPKEIFPQYSVFSKNLIPCCNICNSKKSVKIKENNEFCTYNFYEDEIPTQDFLEVKIEIISGIPRGTFKILEGASTLFRNHIKTLNLLERYSQELNLIFSENERRKKLMTREEFVKQCGIEYKVCKDKYGSNNYRGLLYQEMGKSEEYLNYLFG